MPRCSSAFHGGCILDLDPGFNQVWHAGDGIDMRFDAHTHFATVGLAVGRPGCAVPTCDRSWFATCPPVVTVEWTVADEISRDAFTTVANWRSYGSAHYNGVFLGQKAHALRPLIDLPRRSRARVRAGALDSRRRTGRGGARTARLVDRRSD